MPDDDTLPSAPYTANEYGHGPGRSPKTFTVGQHLENARPEDLISLSEARKDEAVRRIVPAEVG